ncbi:MAG: DUF362 domain-containing protein [Thermodesulfobacteriota bacterium]
MDRREFLKQVALWYAGIMTTAPVFRLVPRAMAGTSASPPSGIIVSKGEDYFKITAAVIEKMGGMGRFVKPGAKVVVKPNIGWDRSPEQAANTHPQVVRALVTLALDAGAASVQVFDRTCNEERRCYQNSGIKPELEKIKDPRVKCEFIDERKFVPVKIEGGKALKEWQFYKDALEADCYINVPVAKHHGLSGLTLGMKNIMGVIGGRRGQIHHDIGRNLADLNTVIRPSLTVVDATRLLLRSGPQGGKIEDVSIRNTVLASTDPVAADAYATTLFGQTPDAITSTVAAFEMGLGEMRLEKCTITEV